jgi:hypothetical protein
MASSRSCTLASGCNALRLRLRPDTVEPPRYARRGREAAPEGENERGHIPLGTDSFGMGEKGDRVPVGACLLREERDHLYGRCCLIRRVNDLGDVRDEGVGDPNHLRRLAVPTFRS